MSDDRDTGPEAAWATASSLVPRMQRVRGEDDERDDAVRLAQLRAQLLDRHDSPVRIARFTLVRPLGKGGMGTVYEAYDPELDRAVAIKVVRVREADAIAPLRDADGRARLLEEGRALARLVHPNVVTVHEVGTHEGEAFVVMELVKGPNLRAWMQRPGDERRSWPEVVDVFVAAANGLAAAHAAGIRHGDVKPDNIVVGGDGRTRVVDFGIAALVEQHGDTGAGTPGYIAPEQVASATVDARSDQYGLGIALFEVLHRRRPSSTPPRCDVTVPRWLARIIARSTAVDPGDRFATMAELAAALAKGRRSLWRSRAIGGVLAVGAVAAAAVALGVVPRDPCATIDPPLAELADVEDARLRAHVERLGELGEQICRWDHAPPAARPALLEARHACLAEAASMTAVGFAWRLRHPDADLVWPYALDGLEAAARCDDVDALRARSEPIEPDEVRGGEVDWTLVLANAEAEAGFAAAGLERLEALRDEGDGSVAREGKLRLLAARIALADGRPLPTAELEGVLWSTVAGDRRFDAVQAATLLALVIAERDGTAAAAPWFELAAALLEGAGDPPRLRAELELARARALAQDERDAAAELALEAAAAATNPEDVEGMITLLTIRAAVRVLERRWIEARSDYAMALALHLHRHGEGHPAALALQQHLALTLVGEGREDEALPALERSLAAMEARLGPTHGWTLRAKRVRCILLGQRDGPLADEPCQRELVDAYAQAGMSRLADSVRVDRADLLSLLGRYDEAAAVLRGVLELREPPRPVLQIVAALARVEALAGRPELGLRLLEDRLASGELRSQAADVARLTQVDLLLEAGRIDDADRVLQDAFTRATSDPIAFVARRGMVAAARGELRQAVADLETGALMPNVEVDVLGPVTQRLAETRARLDPNDPRIPEVAAVALQLYDYAPGRAARAAALRAWLSSLPERPRP